MCHNIAVTITALSLIIYFGVVNHSPARDQELVVSQEDTVDWTSIGSSNGDRFPDFSYCGYHGSEKSLPYSDSPNVTMALPSKATEDMRPAIQQAIDTLALSGGGVIRLPSGRLSITAGIQLRSNIVVTGSEDGSTVIVLKSQPSKPVFTLGSLDSLDNATEAEFRASSNITNDYVPIGSSKLNILDSAGFSVNQSVYVARAVTGSWVRYNGMADLRRDGARQTWIPVGKMIMSPNKIASINGTQITLQIPLTDALNARYMKPELLAYTPPPLNSEMGLSNLRIEVPKTCSGASLHDTTCNYAAVAFPSWTVDSWASGLDLVGFNSFFDIREDASRITIQNSTMNRNRDIKGKALPIDILIKGSQVLIQDCSQVGLRTARCFSVATDSLTAGPNVVARHATTSKIQTIAPHERWAQGLLVEMTSVPTLFEDRGTKGTGHGWTMNAGVGWNLKGEAVFQSPPLGINWCIGCGGKDRAAGNATFIRDGKQVKPQSLFAAQLQARGVEWHTKEYS
ncbi:hypothetical protein B0T10DRAFT_407446 [Thelonectria olida]|uniref:Pectate lyase superfamily protein domain-containing protein n=1 Tax=Thelonectria olida TaxID=1576542 RepID=A0A9P8W1S5_9HYPO|nr:hypothetical protein B0T10DRAFT_407446 [Thelonectria olida]